jgi:hypothetical protein
MQPLAILALRRAQETSQAHDPDAAAELSELEQRLAPGQLAPAHPAA